MSNAALSANALSPQNALAVLAASTKLPGHRFWPADIPVTRAFELVKESPTGHRQITEFYLVALALHHGGRLATLDESIGALGEAVELIV